MFGVFNWPGAHNKIRPPAHDLKVNGEVHSRYSPPRYLLHSQLTTGTRLTIETGVYINHNEVSSYPPIDHRTCLIASEHPKLSCFLPALQLSFLFPFCGRIKRIPEPFIGTMKLLSQEDSGQHPATSNMALFSDSLGEGSYDIYGRF